ncbi:MAG: hypothetical protein AAGC88_06295 [Bacteroidota bacterium]
MSNKKDKKQSPVGCLIFLAISIVTFVFLPWQVALGATVVLFFLILIINAIVVEFRKISQRNDTQKSLISQASSGFTELHAKVKPKNESLKTWLTGEPADYRWVSFKKFYRPKNSTNTGRGDWVSFHDEESENKALTISDGSAECKALMHMVDLRVKMKTKKMKPVELLQALKTNPIEDFDVNKLDKDRIVLVEEKWIPKDEYMFFYGDMYSFDEQPPKSLIEGIEKSWRGGNYRDKQRKLSEQDWEALVDEFRSNGQSKAKVIATNYDQDPADGLIISNAGDAKVNLFSYLSILAMLFGIVFVLAFAYLILNAEHPEIIEQVLQLFK